jgi:hypothetical protein
MITVSNQKFGSLKRAKAFLARVQVGIVLQGSFLE